MESQRLPRHFQFFGKTRSPAQIVFIIVKAWNDRQADGQIPVRQIGQIPDDSLVGDSQDFPVAGVIHMLQVNEKLIDDPGELKTQLTGKESVGFRCSVDAISMQEGCCGKKIFCLKRGFSAGKCHAASGLFIKDLIAENFLHELFQRNFFAINLQGVLGAVIGALPAAVAEPFVDPVIMNCMFRTDLFAFAAVLLCVHCLPSLLFPVQVCDNEVRNHGLPGTP